MMRRLLRLMALALLAAVWIPALAAGAGAEAAFVDETEPEDGPGTLGGRFAFIEGEALPMGRLAEVALDGTPKSYSFVALSGSVYEAWLFPAGDGSVEAHA